MKRRAGQAALSYVGRDDVLGVGSGTTAALFVAALAAAPVRPALTVPSSPATEALLRAAGLPVAPLGDAPAPSVYVDGADEVDPSCRLLKGRGGAHTREKVLATMTPRFVCIVDQTKLVTRLGAAPLVLEVLPVARRLVLDELAARGAAVGVRAALSADGNLLLDATGLVLDDPERLELELEALPGVVACGLFARRPADVVLAAGPAGVLTLTRTPSAGASTAAGRRRP